MESDTPLSQLVLWVPPAIAAGWEHLSIERQRWWTEQLTAHWLELITTPGPEPVLSKCGLLRSHAQYETFQRRMAEIDAQYPRVPSDRGLGQSTLLALPQLDFPPLPEVPPLPERPPVRPLNRPRTPEEVAEDQAFDAAHKVWFAAHMQHMEAINTRLQAMIDRHDAWFGSPKEARDA